MPQSRYSSIQVQDEAIRETERHNEDDIIVAMSDEITELVDGDGKVTIYAPYALTLEDVIAGLSAQSSAGVVTVDIERQGTTIFSTLLTIDVSEDTSETAATPFVFDGAETTWAKGDKIVFNLDTDGTAAKGLKVTLIVKKV